MTYEEALQIAIEDLYNAVRVLRRNNKGYEEAIDMECNRLLTAHDVLRKALEEKREWVGLTDDEIEYSKIYSFDFYAGAKWAEEKLKEKNT